MAWLRNLFSRLTGKRRCSRPHPPALPDRREPRPSLPPPPRRPRLPPPAHAVLREPTVPLEPVVATEPKVATEPSLSFSEA
jgi:hypothetical protein